MYDRDRVYCLILTHALGHPYFDYVFFNSSPPKRMNVKSKMKSYIFKLINISQSDTFLKMAILSLSINCLYERYLNA